MTIKVREVGGKLRFVGPATVTVGDDLEIVNKTDPQRVGPVTFSLVRPGYLPKTRHAQARCFTPGHICWAIAEWQGVHGEGVPTINPAEAGAPGWDTPARPASRRLLVQRDRSRGAARPGGDREGGPPALVHGRDPPLAAGDDRASLQGPVVRAKETGW